MDQVFFQLLRISVGCCDALKEVPTAAQWQAIYAMANKQTLIGVMYSAIEKLSKEQRPPKELLLQWFMMKEQLVRRNRLMNQRAVETMQFFRREGFDCCILKGQGVATYYPVPLLRTPGDIDIWLSGGRKRIYDFARKRVGLQGMTYQHIHYPLHKDAEVEVHITPGHLFSPFTNRKLQQFFDTCAKEQFCHEVDLPDGIGRIGVPTDEFNRVYILLHIYVHLFGEDIGLRQVLDYYYVLRQSTSEESKARTIEMLGQLQMLKFARAMMWVQQKIFGLEEEHLLVKPDEKEGRFLLSEIMQAGNFGKYDARIDRSNHHRLLPRVWNSVKRNWKFVVRYPHEMIWNMPFRLCLYVWRLFKR